MGIIEQVGIRARKIILNQEVGRGKEDFITGIRKDWGDWEMNY